MISESTGKRLLYHHPFSGRKIEVDAIIDGDLVDLIPQESEIILADRIVRLKLAPDRSLDEIARESLGNLLHGFDLIGTDGETTEIERTVIYEMRKTPISLKDGVYEKGYVRSMCLCLDLREFSSFARDSRREMVQGFLERYTQELLAGINGYSVSYYKLLGDGALVIWDEPSYEDLIGALEFFEILRGIVRDVGAEFGYCGCVAGALAIDELYKYEMYAETSGLKYRDYIGYGINYVFRLQAMAAAGELLANKSIVDRFGLELERFPESRKPERGGIKGIKDEDYEAIFVLVPADLSACRNV